MQAKPQRKSTGCACDQTTKKFHRSKSDKDTKIEAMMSLWYNATRLDVFMEAKQELVIFDVEPEERTEKWMQQLPDRVYKIYREIAKRMKNKRYFLIKF